MGSAPLRESPYELLRALDGRAQLATRHASVSRSSPLTCKARERTAVSGRREAQRVQADGMPHSVPRPRSGENEKRGWSAQPTAILRIARIYADPVELRGIEPLTS